MCRGSDGDSGAIIGKSLAQGTGGDILGQHMAMENYSVATTYGVRVWVVDVYFLYNWCQHSHITEVWHATCSASQNR